jgi:hypothetical protein
MRAHQLPIELQVPGDDSGDDLGFFDDRSFAGCRPRR